MINHKKINNKKILFISTIPSSLYIFYKNMLKELSNTYEVVAVSSPGKYLDLIGQREGVRTVSVQMERHVSVLNDIKSLFKLIKLFVKERPIMVHSITPKAGLLSMMSAWIVGVPIRIHTFTGLLFPTTKGFTRKILIMTDSITCACATHIIPEGEGVKNDIIANGITKKKLKVLGYGNIRGVDMDFYSRRSIVLELADKISCNQNNPFTFLFVGRIVKDKGIDELCYAIEKLSTFLNVKLFLVGKFEDKLNPISNKSRDIIRNNPAIEFVGTKFEDELLSYYVASDCYVFPSYREGFPNTVLEAGAMGLPSIVTDINGSREIIKDGENGIIIPSHDADSLFNAMLYMIQNPNDRERMAKNAREMIASRFEQRFVRNCLYEYYHDVLTQYVSKNV